MTENTLYKILRTVVGNHIQLGISPEEIIETLSEFYRDACDFLVTLKEQKEDKKNAETGKPEVRADNDELR